MTDNGTRIRRIFARWRAAVVIAAVVLFAIGFAANNLVFGALVIVTVLGGTISALVRIVRHRSAHASLVVPDHFARDVFSTDTLNFAHVRVAGVGGAGLVLAAFAITLDFEIARAVTVMGLIGGALMATGMILHRRRRGPMPSSSRGPGARTMLCAESSTAARPRRQPSGIGTHQISPVSV